MGGDGEAGDGGLNGAGVSPLPVARILVGAVAIPWTFARAYARALALPALLLFIVTALDHLAPEGNLRPARGALSLAELAATVVFTVICHRLVLLAQGPDGDEAGRLSLGRSLRFAGWVLVVGLVYVVMAAPLSAVLARFLPGEFDAGGLTSAAFMAIFLLPLYVIARILLVLPGTAIDQQVNLRWSWNRTRGNGWRLVGTVLLLPKALSAFTDSLMTGDSPLALVLLASAAETMLYVFEVTALSLAFRELQR